ncbi:hypothetical protein DL765_011104 [Monosporascus sp. GIB2]|nr:hypothetical protein DL765_011104 [Monosporascus sp. GIB2]
MTRKLLRSRRREAFKEEMLGLLQNILIEPCCPASNSANPGTKDNTGAAKKERQRQLSTHTISTFRVDANSWCDTALPPEGADEQESFLRGYRLVSPKPRYRLLETMNETKPATPLNTRLLVSKIILR